MSTLSVPISHLMSLLGLLQTMWLKVIFGTFAVLLQLGTVSTQRQWVPPTTTAAEMWNPYTWYWPYAIAASEGYREYFQNAQQITNQLYMQAYATNAFWWTYRPNNGSGGAVGQAGQAAGGAAGQAGQAAGGAAGQAGQAAGGATGQAGQATGGTTGQAGQGMGGAGNQPVANMAQGGTGWGK